MIKSENRSCRYEAGIVCAYTQECAFPSIVICLQQNLYLAQREISTLKERRNQRHTKASIKWRNNSFYYKKKCRCLEEWIKEKGINVPSISQLFPKDEGINLEPKVMGGETNGRICSNDSEGVQEGPRDILPGTE